MFSILGHPFRFQETFAKLILRVSRVLALS
jgi:hypothetical protein